MAVDAEETSQGERPEDDLSANNNSAISSNTAEDHEEEEEEEDDEPKLKYARLTGHLGGVYRNGDATSTFLVAGDKMVCYAARILRETKELCSESHKLMSFR